jgi:1,4-dihydroxy-2-naphthoate octaprenyltransferase
VADRGAIAAAWFYTGGRHPYGYLGLGELSVFVFFGLVATVGTSYVQTETITWPAVWAGSGVGAFACAILVANNLRDIPTDRVAGKRTLAVKLGDARTRALFTLLHAAAICLAVVVAAQTTWWVLLAWICVPLSLRAIRVVRRRAIGPELVAALRDTGLAELVYAAGMLAGCILAANAS